MGSSIFSLRFRIICHLLVCSLIVSGLSDNRSLFSFFCCELCFLVHLLVEDNLRLLLLLFEFFLKRVDLVDLFAQAILNRFTLRLLVDIVTDIIAACEHFKWTDGVINIHISNDLTECVFVVCDFLFCISNLREE